MEGGSSLKGGGFVRIQRYCSGNQVAVLLTCCLSVSARPLEPVCLDKVGGVQTSRAPYAGPRVPKRRCYPTGRCTSDFQSLIDYQYTPLSHTLSTGPFWGIWCGKEGRGLHLEVSPTVVPLALPARGVQTAGASRQLLPSQRRKSPLDNPPSSSSSSSPSLAYQTP